jgi:hypothetical protein
MENMTTFLQHSSLQDDGIPVPRAPIPLAVEDFLATMPAAYHDRFSEADARVHAGIVLRRQGASVHLELCSEPNSPGNDTSNSAALLCVVTNHLPGLLRAVTAVLAAYSLNILDKTVYCRVPRNGWSEAISFYRVVPHGEGLVVNDQLVASMRQTIIDVLKGKVDINTLSRRASPTWRPPAPPIDAIPEPEPSSVNFDRLSQIQMTEPAPAPPLTRFSKVPQAAE